jgi:hypothetical protein
LLAAYNIGKGAIAGGAALGLGALCYYGLGLSSRTGAIDHARYMISSLYYLEYYEKNPTKFFN